VAWTVAVPVIFLLANAKERSAGAFYRNLNALSLTQGSRPIGPSPFLFAAGWCTNTAAPGRHDPVLSCVLFGLGRALCPVRDAGNLAAAFDTRSS